MFCSFYLCKSLFLPYFDISSKAKPLFSIIIYVYKCNIYFEANMLVKQTPCPELNVKTCASCIFQGAGAATCAWLCWRTKPPYTSRTRAPALSDVSTGKSCPLYAGTPPSIKNVRPPLSPELKALSGCSRARPQISFRSLNIYSVSGGTQKQNRRQISQHGDRTFTTNLPAKCQRPAKHSGIHTEQTHPPLDCYTHQRQRSCSNHGNCHLRERSQEQTD